MLFSRGQNFKNITKIEQKRLPLFVFLVSYLKVFIAKKTGLHSKYIFSFVFGSFFYQDRLLNLFILGVYAK